MSTTAVPIIRGEGEGERRWFAGGGVHTMKATSEETDGAFMLLENRMVQGKTTPLHIHPNLDEALIVLEGEILVYAEGREHRVGPRGVAVAPRGVPHAFMVTSESANSRAANTWKRRGLLQGSKRAGDCRHGPGEDRLGSPPGSCGAQPRYHTDPRSASVRRG